MKEFLISQITPLNFYLLVLVLVALGFYAVIMFAQKNSSQSQEKQH